MLEKGWVFGISASCYVHSKTVYLAESYNFPRFLQICLEEFPNYKTNPFSDQKEPSDIIFVPGTSVQNFEVLEDEGEQNNRVSTINNEETKTFMRMRNTEEMKEKMDNLFFPTKIAAGMDNCSEQMNIGELAMNDEEKWENERFLKIFGIFFEKRSSS